MSTMPMDPQVAADSAAPRPRLREGRGPFSSYLGAFGLVLLLLGLQAVIGLVVGAALDRAEALLHHEIRAQAITVAVANLLAFGLVLGFAARRAGCGLGEFVPRRRFPPAVLLPMALSVVGAHILLSEANNLLQRVLPAPDWLRHLLGGGADLGGAWAILVLIGVVAPLTEEPLFRGLMLRGLLRRHGPWQAIGATAVLFAVMHLNPWQAPGAVGLGLLFGWWTLRTGSLVPALLGHALNNLLAPLVAVAVGVLHRGAVPGYLASPGHAIGWQPWWLDALGVLLLAGGVATTRALLARSPHRRLEPLPAPPAGRDGDQGNPRDQGLLSSPTTDRAPGSRPRGAVARVLSPVWWIVGWLAFVAVAGFVVLVATRLTGQPFGPWPTAGAYVVLALAVTALLRRTRTLEPAVRVVSPVLLALLVLLFALLRPPDAPARRPAAAPSGPLGLRTSQG
jgi:membrane protease YdiL (CAAX protease family)